MPQKEEIPILAWYSIPAADATAERYSELKEAGFNLSFSHLTRFDDAKKALDLAQQAGIKVIFTCSDLETHPEETVRKVKEHPALAGYFLRDEPGCSGFAALAEWAKKIKTADSAHFCYLNLLPDYAPAEALGVPDYRQYVNRFIREVPIQLLSFDYYPVVGGELRGSWYENLEIFADEARKAGKPFWAFALATAHDPYPVPTTAQLKLQMYSNLAYGAQGLQYFTYWNPDTTTWKFHQAPITLEKRRSPVYDQIRQVNAELQNRAFVFLGARVTGTWHTGETLPAGTRRLETLPGPVRKLDTHGAGALVSQLEKGDRTYLVIVNRSFTGSLNLTLDCDTSVERIGKDGLPIAVNKYTSTWLVEPGEAEILTWKTE